MGNAAARVGDANIPHCSGHNMAQGSGNVFVNGKPLCRKGDSTTSHLLPGVPCPSHSSSIAAGSGTVKANGLGAGRVGDALVACTAIAAGSPNVFIG